MKKLLPQINSSRDLKQIREEDLPFLAEELREAIIHTVATNGGHLSPNLGVVELTIALHYVYNTPEDKIVWDVGHQCYPHKLLTGRRDRFHTLRQDGGISGFPRREESPFDTFNTGHSGTSISAALAFAKARDMKREKRAVVAVIGDGSLTSGLALEGLNNAGALNSDLVVVLNDNEMSISPNVGALSEHLNRIISGDLYKKMKDEMDGFIKTVPRFGDQMVKLVHKVEEAVKGIVVPGRLFEDLGFTYYGPIDGHNQDLLIETFGRAKNMKGPILVHVVTKKGKGYSPAEEKACNYHGTPPFNVESGDFAAKGSSVPTYTQVFGETLVDLADKNEKVVALTAAMTDGTGLKAFSEKFPDRFYDVGIAEQHAVAFSAGLAIAGFRPVVAIYSTFLQRAFDQILHDVCQMNLPVVFAMDRAGIVGEDGPTHQGLFDLSYMRSLPNMTVMAPKDENELARMLATALTLEGPAVVRYPRGAGQGAKMERGCEPFEVGRGEVVRRGKDCAIMAIGNRVATALEAADKLSADGLEATVVNMRFVKPIDKELVEEIARDHEYLITVEENMLDGGFGSAVLEVLENFNEKRPLIKRIGIPSVFVEHGAPGILRERYGLDTQGIFNSVKELAATGGKRPNLQIAGR